MLEALLAWQEDPGGGDEDDRFFRVAQVAEAAGDLVLTLAGRDAWSERSSLWRVRARSVRGAQFKLPLDASSIELAEEHPLLLPHASRCTELFVHAAPEDPARLLGDLWRAHHGVAGGWIQPDPYINWDYAPLSGEAGLGTGQLAKGPRPLLDVYAEVARRYAMRPKLVGDHAPVHWNGEQHQEQTEPLFALLLGDSWIVAEAYTAERLDAEG